MGKSVLIRREEQMSHLQPNLGDTGRQELRSSPFAPTPLFHSQLVKDCEEFLLKKASPQNTRGFKPYQNQPFRGPLHNKKRGSYRKRPYGGQSTSSNQSFSSNKENSNYIGNKGHFRPHHKGRGCCNPSPQ